MTDKTVETIERIKSEKDIVTRARLVKHILREGQIKLKDLALKLGIKPSYVCHINRLNKLPEIIIDGFYSKQISVSHLFLLSRLNDEKKMAVIYEEILTHGMNIKQTEDRIREYIYGIKNKGRYLNERERNEIETKINGIYPDSVTKIVQTRVYGKLTIIFKGDLNKSSKFLRDVTIKIT